MKLYIETAMNGFVVTDDEGAKAVFSDDDNLKSVVSMLHYINEQIGEVGSRYDEQRIYIILRPGDKNEKFTEQDSKVIWGD